MQRGKSERKENQKRKRDGGRGKRSAASVASAPTLHGCALHRCWVEESEVKRESVGGETVLKELLRNVRGTHSQRTPNQLASLGSKR